MGQSSLSCSLWTNFCVRLRPGAVAGVQSWGQTMLSWLKRCASTCVCVWLVLTPWLTLIDASAPCDPAPRSAPAPTGHSQGGVGEGVQEGVKPGAAQSPPCASGCKWVEEKRDWRLQWRCREGFHHSNTLEPWKWVKIRHWTNNSSNDW